MEDIKSKILPSLLFSALLLFIFIRPFFSGLAYPGLESYYENLVILCAIITIIACNKAPLKAAPYSIPILLLFLSYIISSITSVNTGNSIKETIKFTSFFSIFFMVSMSSKDQKRFLIKTMVISGVIISLYAIYQYFWGYQDTLDYLKKINSGLLSNSSYARDILISKRAIGTFPSPTIFGGYLIIVFFLALQLVSDKTNNLSKTALIISLLLISFGLLITKSMGAWLSLITSLIALFIISKPKKLITVFFFIFVAIALGFIFSTRWDRLVNLENPENSITQRFSYWLTAIRIIKDHPILGVGPGNFQEVFLKYKIVLGTNTRYAHNIFLQIWSEAGLLGLISIFYLIINFLRQFNEKMSLRGAKRRSNPSIEIASGTSCPRNDIKFLFFGCLAFILHNIIDNTYFIPEVGLLWWALLGISCSCAARIPENSQNK